MDRLPEEIINKIILYISHPVADIFKQSDYYKFFHELVDIDLFSKYVFKYIAYSRIENYNEYWDEVFASSLNKYWN